MASSNTDKDNGQEPEECRPETLQIDITPCQPDQSAATPQNRFCHRLPDTSHSAPKPLDPSASSLRVPSFRPTSLPRRSRERDSNGDIKQMVAELKARADSAIARDEAVTTEGWKFGSVPCPPRAWINGWEAGTLTKYPSIASHMATPRIPTSTNTPSMVAHKEAEEESQTGKRKRQGSLLEWRNKDMFEEPVRI